MDTKQKRKKEVISPILEYAADKRLSDGDFRTLVVLCFRTNKDGKNGWGREKLSIATTKTKRGLIEIIRKLERLTPLKTEIITAGGELPGNSGAKRKRMIYDLSEIVFPDSAPPDEEPTGEATSGEATSGEAGSGEATSGEVTDPGEATSPEATSPTPEKLLHSSGEATSPPLRYKSSYKSNSYKRGSDPNNPFKNPAEKTEEIWDAIKNKKKLDPKMFKERFNDAKDVCDLIPKGISDAAKRLAKAGWLEFTKTGMIYEVYWTEPHTLLYLESNPNSLDDSPEFENLVAKFSHRKV